MGSKIRTKLLKIFALALAPILLMAGVSLYNQHSIHRSNATVNAVAAEARAVNELQLAFDRVLMPSNDYIITGNSKYVIEFDLHAGEMDRLVRKAETVLNEQAEELDERVISDEKALLRDVSESWANVKAISRRIFAIDNPVGDREAARLMEEMDYKWGFPAIKRLNKWHEIDQNEYMEALRYADSAWVRAWGIMGGGLAVTALLTVAIAYHYSGVFVRPIEALKERSLKIAGGDFKARASIKTGDELEDLSEAMDRMSSELSALYGDLERKVEERTKELHDANMELRAGEERYKGLFNGINDAVFVHSVPADDTFSFRFIDVNDTACAMYGYTKDEFLATPPEAIEAPGMEVVREGAVRKFIQNGYVTCEMVHESKDGRKIPVEINTRSFEHKGAVMALSVVRDITDRKKAEYAAARERCLNESIVYNMPAGIAFLDNGFVLRKFNASYAVMIRKYSPYAPEEALGRSYFDYIPGSREQVEGWFKEVRDSGESSSRQGFELKLSEDISTYWDTSITPVFDEAGKVEGILILTQDITERKKGEDSLKERIEELEMFRKLTLKRELRLRELKDRIEALEMELKGARA